MLTVIILPKIGLLKVCSNGNRSLHGEGAGIDCLAIRVHAHAHERRGARGCRWAVTSENTACETAVLVTSVLVLQDALWLRVRHAFREVRRAGARGIARSSAQLASALELTLDLVIKARRSTVMVVIRRRSWCWCWSWCWWRSRSRSWGRARRSADSWVGWRTISNAALVHTTLDEDVTIHAPACSPRILHLPVVLAGISSVTNCEDTVIEILAAVSGENTAAVKLEAHLVSLDGNADRAVVCHGIEEVRLAGDVLVTGDTTLRNGFSVAGLASAILSGVSVGRFGGDAGLLIEGECVIHQTTVATGILLGAIDQLLLAEGLQVSSGDLPLAFKTTSGRECPA
jgi:hypothetical protein